MPSNATFRTFFTALRKYIESVQCGLVFDEKRSKYPDLYGALKVESRKLTVHIYVQNEMVWMECRGFYQPCELSVYQDRYVKGLGEECLSEGLNNARIYLKHLLDRVAVQLATECSLPQKAMGVIEGLFGVGPCAIANVCEKVESVIIQDEPQDVNHNQEVLFALLNESQRKPRAIFKDAKRNAALSENARKELSKFRLWGLLLWDRYRDTYIEETVAKKYGTLQENAGDYFKFIPLFSRSSNKYGDALGGAFDDVKKKIVDDAAYAHALFSALEISEQSIPYLVVADWLQSSEILLVPADQVKNLPHLVECLGMLVKNGRVSLAECQNELRHQGFRSEIRKLGNRNFVDRLINPLTIIMLNDETGIRAQVEAPGKLLCQARDELLSLQNKLRKLQDEIETVDRTATEYGNLRAEYEHLNMTLLHSSAQNLQDIADYGMCGISFDVNGLDYESRVNLNSAVRGMSMLDYFKEDVSPIIVSLGKMFENEMNTSLVQYIREEMGIPMSEYFCLPYPQDPLKSFVEGKADFNRQNVLGQWQAPETGCTRWVVNRYERYWTSLNKRYPQIFGGISDLTREFLCRQWGSLCACRNAAAHPNPEGHSLKKLEQMKNALGALSDKGCFVFMRNLREKMRNRD